MSASPLPKGSSQSENTAPPMVYGSLLQGSQQSSQQFDAFSPHELLHVPSPQEVFELCWHVPFEQVSTVQGFPSSQSPLLQHWAQS